MISAKKKPNQTVYQLKITLKQIRPPIWRRVQVLGSTSLPQLHEIIQIIMDWGNYHLHQFTISGMDYGVEDPDFPSGLLPENQLRLADFCSSEKSKFSYTYDFGDCWEHEILVEKILTPDSKINYPLCLKGKRACPPEDCGGVWGYQDFLEAIGDPNHEEHESLKEWIGGDFDPEKFNLEQANQRLEQLK